jgi:hypothetical protein
MCNQPTKVFPEPVKKQVKKNTADYYLCLMHQAQKGFQQPITKVCRECKLNNNDLSNQRQQEVSNLMNAYEQMGNCLRNLLIENN